MFTWIRLLVFIYSFNFLSLKFQNIEFFVTLFCGERGGSVVVCRTPERDVVGSKPTATMLCPWARHFTPRKYWLITQEAVAPSRHDWKIVDWDVKPQHNQPTLFCKAYKVETWYTHGQWVDTWAVGLPGVCEFCSLSAIFSMIFLDDKYQAQML